MRRTLARVVVGLLIGCLGCSTAASERINWPWSKSSALAEEYVVPPPHDDRYSSAPTLPRSVIKPGLKPQSSDPKRPTQPGMGAPPGMMMPGMQPGGPGGGLIY
ncbi:MAG: hypothetical protein NZM31_13925 [Gemmatales bacterium]|nr:hypothetical protein [Gemmatales bacterium]MDW8388094.1 hypothetical protein [Gemmatales bacterium]